jgi:hypothetical protein
VTTQAAIVLSPWPRCHGACWPTRPPKAHALDPPQHSVPQPHPGSDPPEPLMTRQVLARGQERYDIFCAPCHGFAGDGDGMVVQRGFPAPPSFHTEPQLDLTAQRVVDVITHGTGRMLPMAERIPRPTAGRSPPMSRRCNSASRRWRQEMSQERNHECRGCPLSRATTRALGIAAALAASLVVLVIGEASVLEAWLVGFVLLAGASAGALALLLDRPHPGRGLAAADPGRVGGHCRPGPDGRGSGPADRHLP